MDNVESVVGAVEKRIAHDRALAVLNGRPALAAKLRAGFRTEEGLLEWLMTPNRAFEDRRPVEVIQAGEEQRLETMLYYLESGVAS